MLESKIQKTILDYLKGVPNLYAVNFVGSAVTAKGTPDVLVCYKGRFIALEVKRPDGSYGVTHAQQGRLRQIGNAGGLAYVVTSLAEVVDIIERLEYDK